MTDEDKALVDRLREADDWYFDEPWERTTLVSDAPFKAADRIEAQAAEIERLREALRRGHFIHLTKEEVDDAKAKGIPLRDYAIAKRKTALEETLHVSETCKENGESFT